MSDRVRFSLRGAMATVCRRIGLWHNVPPLDAGPKRRPVLRGLATSGCYATALSFLFSFFKRYRERRYNDLYRMDAAGRAYMKASLLSEDYDFNLNLGLCEN